MVLRKFPIAASMCFLSVGLLFAVLLRFYGLAYNTAFNDEAIYIVIGKLGLFEWDWWSYNAQSWMAGLPYVYPPLAALAAETYGIVGARLLSVFVSLFIVEEIYRLAVSVTIFDRRYAKLAGMVAAFIAAFSGVGLYISRLATYDALAILFLLFSVNLLLHAPARTDGRDYFLAALSFFFAISTKIIIGAYLPLLLLLSLRNTGDPHTRSLWIRYFILPFGLLMVFFMLINLKGFFQYAQSQVEREHYGFPVIFGALWSYIHFTLLLAVPAVLAAFLWGKRKATTLLLLSALILPAVHILTHRHATLDKHSFFFVIFISILLGHGIAALLHTRYVQWIGLPVFVLGAVFYGYGEVRALRILEQEWENTQHMVLFLRDQVQADDRVLFEEGASGILGLYDITPPHNVTTFDWFEYRHRTGDLAYVKAVEDKYFQFIELSGKNYYHPRLAEKIRSKLPSRYILVYNHFPFEIYEAVP